MKKRFQIRIHPAGAAVLVLAFLFLPSAQVLACVAALLWHEGGHLLAMYLCGAEGCTVELTPFGGMADVRHFERLSPCRQAVSAAAGVVASGIGAWVSREFLSWNELYQCHLSLGAFNALPLWPLDGGRILMSAAVRLGRESQMRRVFACLAWLAGVSLAALGVYGCWLGHINLSLLVSGPYLCYAARMGSVNERIRSIGQTGEKLRPGMTRPVQAFALAETEINALLPRMIARFSPERYHVLLQISQDGSIQRLWTEHEMMNEVMKELPPYIDSKKDVDKTAPL